MLHDEESAMKIWQILEAVQWRWTIKEVLEQPNAILEDVLQIAGISRSAQLRSD